MPKKSSTSTKPTTCTLSVMAGVSPSHPSFESATTLNTEHISNVLLDKKKPYRHPPVGNFRTIPLYFRVSYILFRKFYNNWFQTLRNSEQENPIYIHHLHNTLYTYDEGNECFLWNNKLGLSITTIYIYLF